MTGSNLPPSDVQSVVIPVLRWSVDIYVRINGSDANLASALATSASGGAFRPRRAGAAQFVAASALQGCDVVRRGKRCVLGVRCAGTGNGGVSALTDAHAEGRELRRDRVFYGGFRRVYLLLEALGAVLFLLSIPEISIFSSSAVLSKPQVLRSLRGKRSELSDKAYL